MRFTYRLVCDHNLADVSGRESHQPFAQLGGDYLLVQPYYREYNEIRQCNSESEVV